MWWNLTFIFVFHHTTVRVQLMIRSKKTFQVAVETIGIEIILINDLLCLKSKMKGLCLKGKIAEASRKIISLHHLLIPLPTSDLTHWALLLLSTLTTKSLRSIIKVVTQTSRKFPIRSTTAQLPESLGKMSVSVFYYLEILFTWPFFFSKGSTESQADSLIPCQLSFSGSETERRASFRGCHSVYSAICKICPTENRRRPNSRDSTLLIRPFKSIHQAIGNLPSGRLQSCPPGEQLRFLV